MARPVRVVRQRMLQGTYKAHAWRFGGVGWDPSVCGGAAHQLRDLGEPIGHADLDRRPRPSLLARDGLVGDGSTQLMSSWSWFRSVTSFCWASSTSAAFSRTFTQTKLCSG